METNNATPNTMQLPLLDLADGVSVKRELDKALRKEENRIEFLMRKVRTLHEELNQALYTAKVKDKPVINSPADAYAILQPFMGSLQHEELWVVLLNTRNHVLELVRLYKGSTNSSQVKVGEVFRAAIARGGVNAVVIAHNHPSNVSTPSPDDVAVTRAIVQAGKLLDVSVLDHLVVCADRYASLKELGLGFS